MRHRATIGLRTRLALALAGIAVISVAIATVLSNAGVDSRLNAFARERLRTVAIHSAQLAAGFYEQRHRWTPGSAIRLGHLAALNGYRLLLQDSAGHRLTGSATAAQGAHAQVLVGGRRVGSVTVAPLRDAILTGEDSSLHRNLIDLHLLTGAVAVVLALLAATLLAAGLARPLRRLTAVARRMELGDLAARVNARGVPEIAELGQALNRLAETLQHEDQLRRTAAADIAHELRTPLAGVLSRVEAAQDGVLEDEPRNLEAIHTEALRLTQLVEDLGKLAEAEQPGLTVQKELVDLGRLVAERADVYHDQFCAKGVALEQSVKPVSAYGEPGRIAQIIDNLLSNALRHTEPEGRVSISAYQHGDEAVVEVVDSGAGISDEDLPHIFERFWRGEHSRARKSGGAGIGLAIVRELVRAHDGRIDVASKPGEGSRFSLALPAAGTKPRHATSPNSASSTGESSAVAS